MSRMTSRERVKNAMHYRKVDKVPVQYFYTPVGFYEHREKLNDLYATMPGDFEPFARVPIPAIPEAHLDAKGNYHAFWRDEWSTLWEYRIFGIAGIPAEYPLANLEALESFPYPPDAALSGPDFDVYCKSVAAHQEQWYYLQHTGSLFERLIALRPEEDVLCDIALDELEINRLADKIVTHSAAVVRRAVLARADGITFGDDYGTERSLIMSPSTWRLFIKPRLRELFAPAVQAGLDVHFHSCGLITDILEDLREVGVTSIWPQLPVYDMKELAVRCRSLGLAVAVHTDRAKTMTHGTPQMVRDLVLREYEVFQMQDGGSWFYIEADNGFPFANLEALVNTVRELRGEL